MKIASEKPLLPLLLLMAVAAFFLAPHNGYYWDIRSWTGWSLAIRDFGFRDMYQHSDCNYLPGFLYLLKIYSWFNPHPEIFTQKIIVLKTMIFSVELCFAWLIYKAMPVKRMWWLLLLLALPAFWYNSLIFVQMDGLYVLPVILCLMLYFGKKPEYAAPFFVIAFLVKVQALQFLPLLVWLQLTRVNSGQHWKSIVASLLLLLIVCLPFDPRKLTEIVMDSIGHFTQLSLLAFNIWYLVAGADPVTINDTSVTSIGLTWRQLAFSLTALAFLIQARWLAGVLGKSNLAQWLRHPDPDSILLLGILINLTFYLLMPEMHDRYVHPAVLFALFYTYRNGTILLFLLLSAAYVLTLDLVMHQWFFSETTSNYITGRWIALLYLLTFSGYLSVFIKTTMYRRAMLEGGMTTVGDNNEISYL